MDDTLAGSVKHGSYTRYNSVLNENKCDHTQSMSVSHSGLIQSMCNKRMCSKVFMEGGRGGCVMINTSADEMRAH